MTPQGRVVPPSLCGVRVSFIVRSNRASLPGAQRLPDLGGAAGTANRGFLSHHLGAWHPG